MTGLVAGVTGAGAGQGGVAWNVLGHRYLLKAECGTSFAFETLDPPGSFVPLHVHPTQDEFIWVIEGELALQLGRERTRAAPGDLARLPRGVPHAYANDGAAPARALFWVSPAGRLRELFDRLHDLTDVDEVVRLSRLCGVEFLPSTG